MKFLKTVIGQGPDIVIVPGALAHSDDMQIITDQLSSYRVTTLDLPGKGPSAWYESINNIQEEVDYILSELPDEAIYIVWSKGGLTLSSLAARYPKKVKHFIGICTTPKFIATEGWIGVPPPGFVSIIMPLLETTKFIDLMRDMYEPEFVNIDPKPELYHRAIAICNKRPDIPLNIIQKILHIVDTSDCREDFAKINCPIDLILGTNDAAVPYAAVKQITALNPNVKTHAIDGAQHVPFLTHPQQFNQILHKILEDHK